MNEIKIRGYHPGEEDELRRLYIDTTRNVIGRDYTADQVEYWVSRHDDPARWEERIRARNPFVAESGGRILGFAELEPDGHIDCFYCHHEHLGQGIGTLLLSAVEKEAARLGLDALHASVSVTARPFFTRRGFSVTEERRNTVCGAEARQFMMWKRLTTTV